MSGGNCHHCTKYSILQNVIRFRRMRSGIEGKALGSTARLSLPSSPRGRDRNSLPPPPDWLSGRLAGRTTRGYSPMEGSASGVLLGGITSPLTSGPSLGRLPLPLSLGGRDGEPPLPLPDWLSGRASKGHSLGGRSTSEAPRGSNTSPLASGPDLGRLPMPISLGGLDGEPCLPPPDWLSGRASKK